MMKFDSLASLRTESSLSWAIQYLAIPWQSGAQGPDAYDCWSFFCMVQEKHFGLKLEAVDIDANDFRASAEHVRDSEERKAWREVQEPKDGDAVLMAHNKYPSHVGLYLSDNDGGVLHCLEDAGVIFSSITSLQVSGWGYIRFYRHASVD